MNTLSLRVSSSNDGRRKKDTFELIQITDKCCEGNCRWMFFWCFLVKIYFLLELKSFVDDINNSSTIENQMNLVKKFALLVREFESLKINEEIVDVLIKTYFFEPTKHPVKTVIQS